MEFIELESLSQNFLQEIERSEHHSQQAEPLWYKSATLIQRSYRGTLVRQDLGLKRKAATRIQKSFRGFFDKERVQSLLKKQREIELEAYYNYQAGKVQRLFRGYYSRRYRHDYFARKTYISSIKKRSDGLRDELVKHLKQQQKQAEDNKLIKSNEEFNKLTESLHYMLSTSNNSGVFALKEATVGGVSLEDTIRKAGKRAIRNRGRLRKTAVH
eukprot:TRINITY_DN2982_c0_g1_i3.p2 TRINITY_DN2982_c0_g1~~TRINITY_DN2982_c0_g1_i3.p2  ORF type:complete len:214 (+),score=26.74 TRINITY_DN2982_c0_g1_i3:138-779(+)